MDEFTIRLLCLSAGVILGWGLGLLHSMNRHAKRTRDNTEYCRAVLQRRLDRDGEVPTPPHAADNGPIDHPDYEGAPKKPLGWRAPRDDRGAVNMTTIGMLVALGVVIVSLFSTLNTNSKLADTQDDLAQQAVIRDKENACTSTILFGTITALNARTEYTEAQATANIELQQAQLRFLRSVDADPPSTEPMEAYIEALTNFIKVTSQQRNTAADNPYPEESEYVDCLEKARSDD